MRKALWLVVAFSLLGAPSFAKKSKEQKEWLAREEAQPLTFTLPAEEAEAAWVRAKIWIATHSRLPIQTSDETIIQTENEKTGDLQNRPRFTAVREKLADGTWRFGVSAYKLGPEGRETQQALQSLAFYIASGEKYPEDAVEEKR